MKESWGEVGRLISDLKSTLNEIGRVDKIAHSLRSRLVDVKQIQYVKKCASEIQLDVDRYLRNNCFFDSTSRFSCLPESPPIFRKELEEVLCRVALFSTHFSVTVEKISLIRTRVGYVSATLKSIAALVDKQKTLEVREECREKTIAVLQSVSNRELLSYAMDHPEVVKIEDLPSELIEIYRNLKFNCQSNRKFNPSFHNESGYVEWWREQD